MKDASLYVSRDNGGALSCIMLAVNAKQKSLSIIACDGHGYYERTLNLEQEKGVKPSLPGKPMHIFIPRNELTAITKNAGNRGNLTLELDNARMQAGNYSVRLGYSDGSTVSFTSPAALEIPDYSGIRKKADKGRKSNINLGQVMLPVKELTRAGKVFPVSACSTIPMYFSPWRKDGLLTLLEYQSESDNIRVIFALNLPEAA